MHAPPRRFVPRRRVDTARNAHRPRQNAALRPRAPAHSRPPRRGLAAPRHCCIPGIASPNRTAASTLSSPRAAIARGACICNYSAPPTSSSRSPAAHAYVITPPRALADIRHDRTRRRALAPRLVPLLRRLSGAALMDRERILDDPRGAVVDYFPDSSAPTSAAACSPRSRPPPRASTYGRTVPAPRLVCAFGDDGLRYRYAPVIGACRHAPPHTADGRRSRRRPAAPSARVLNAPPGLSRARVPG